MKNLLRVALSVIVFLGAAAVARAALADALLDKIGVRGGIALVVGAQDPALIEALAKKDGGLYIQVLAPEAKPAMAWGRRFAAGELRERIGVRCAAFNADDYDYSLFNLIVVVRASALGRAKMKDLRRILVPRGAVAFVQSPGPGFAQTDKPKMTAAKVKGWAGLFFAPEKPVKWKLPVDFKWRGGPHAQIARGFNGMTYGDGKEFYMEQMERDTGDLRKCAGVVFCRDAFNGRAVWLKDVGGYSGRGVVAGTAGKVFVRTASSSVIALDMKSGKLLGTVIPKMYREARVAPLSDDYFTAGRNVCSRANGKPVWRLPACRYQPMRGAVLGKRIYFWDGKTLVARNLADGKEIWKKGLSLPAKSGPNAVKAVDGKYLVIRMAGKSKLDYAFAMVDPADGHVRWTYSWRLIKSNKEAYFSAGRARMTTVDGKLMLYYRHNQMNVYADEFVLTQLDPNTGKEIVKDKVLTPAGDFHGCFGEQYLGDYIAWYDLWVDKKKLVTHVVHAPHPQCFLGSGHSYGLVFDFPSRKSKFLTAVGPAEPRPPEYKKRFVAFAKPCSSISPGARDWPLFRANPAGGNSVTFDLGANLAKAWEVKLGLGGKDFGVMNGQRTGLSQATVVGGTVYVSDIDAQRVLALDAATGKTRWLFPVGARVDYPPAITKGVALVAARDGWVYAIDAKNGKLLWKRLIAPRLRFIGGWDKLESRWPNISDVLLAGGTAYAAAEDCPGIAFNPVTGALKSASNPGKIARGAVRKGPRDLRLVHDFVLKGNSIPRTNEDNWPGFIRNALGSRLNARVLAFDGKLTVAFRFWPRGEGWANKGALKIFAVDKNPRKPVWNTGPIELVVDDMVLTPQHVYAVGHYQRVKKGPELWVMSRANGKVEKTIPLDIFPAFLGMSAAGGRLYIAGREGKLLCLSAGK